MLLLLLLCIMADSNDFQMYVVTEIWERFIQEYIRPYSLHLLTLFLLLLCIMADSNDFRMYVETEI